MTMRFGISSEPMRAGVSRMLMGWLSAADGGGSRASQHRNLTAVEIHGRDVQPSRARGDDEGDEIRHVLDRAVTDNAGLLAELGSDFRLGLARSLDLGTDPPPLSLGLDERGMDAIDPHAVVLAEIRQAFCKAGDCGIDRAADREMLLRLASARPGDCDQRAAALFEERPGRTRKPHMGEKFQRIAIFPIGVGEREKIAAPGRTGIVDENVEAAEFAPHGFDQHRRRARLAQIQRPNGGLAVLCMDRLRNFLERLCIATVEQEITTLLGQSQGDTPADAAARTSDECGLSLQSKLHLPTLMSGETRRWLSLSHWRGRR